MENKELKPCPCCGSKAVLKRMSSGDDYVKCSNPNCGMRTKRCKDNVNCAVMVWNARAVQL